MIKKYIILLVLFLLFKNIYSQEILAGQYAPNDYFHDVVPDTTLTSSYGAGNSTLAIFNIDDEQTYYFKGLNTPTNTVLIFGLSYVYKEFGSFGFLVENEIYLLILTLVSSWILVSPVRMISMKFKSKKLADNYSKVVLLVGGILILAIFQFNGIPLIVIYYILVSLIFQRQLRS